MKKFVEEQLLKSVHVWSPERMVYISLSTLLVKSTLPVVKNFRYWLDKKLIGLGGVFLALPFLHVGLRLGTDKNDSQ